MPYRIEWLKNGVCVTSFGKYSLEDSIKSNGELYGHHRYDTIKYQIGDYLDATVSLRLQDVRIVAALDSSSTKWNNEMKVAHVTKDQTFIENIKVYEKTMADTEWEFAIFDTMEEAWEWVGEK